MRTEECALQGEPWRQIDAYPNKKASGQAFFGYQLRIRTSMPLPSSFF
jgi:hypothetical protein